MTRNSTMPQRPSRGPRPEYRGRLGSGGGNGRETKTRRRPRLSDTVSETVGHYESHGETQTRPRLSDTVRLFTVRFCRTLLYLPCEESPMMQH